MSERLAFVVSDLDEMFLVLNQLAEEERCDHAVYRGTVGAQGRAIQRLLAGDSATNISQEFFAAGRLNELAELWVEGLAVKWRAIRGTSVSRCELPPYRFVGKKHWVQTSDTTGSSESTTTQVNLAAFDVYVPQWSTINT